MLKIANDYTIRYTQGDTFVANFYGYTLKEGYVATFNIKQDGNLLLYADIKGEGQRTLKFYLSQKDMQLLPAGNMTYDIKVTYPDGRKYTVFSGDMIIAQTARNG